MIKGVCYLFVVILVISACVSNKKVTYLQNEDLNVKGLSKDTVLRTYDLVDFSYLIQPEDVLSISVKSLTDDKYNFFSGSTGQSNQTNITATGANLAGSLVDESGSVEFPEVGKVVVAGLNIYEAQEKIKLIAERYVSDPVVKIRLLNFRFTVLGEVIKESTIISVNNRISMLEAIGLSGGFGELADRSNVKLLRQYGNRTEIQYLDFLKEDFINSPYYYVHQNDVLVVPPIKQRPFRKYFGQNLSLIVTSFSFLLLVITLIRQ